MQWHRFIVNTVKWNRHIFHDPSPFLNNLDYFSFFKYFETFWKSMIIIIIIRINQYLFPDVLFLCIYPFLYFIAQNFKQSCNRTPPYFLWKKQTEIDIYICFQNWEDFQMWPIWGFKNVEGVGIVFYEIDPNKTIWTVNIYASNKKKSLNIWWLYAPPLTTATY